MIDNGSPEIPGDIPVAKRVIVGSEFTLKVDTCMLKFVLDGTSIEIPLRVKEIEGMLYHINKAIELFGQMTDDQLHQVRKRHSDPEFTEG